MTEKNSFERCKKNNSRHYNEILNTFAIAFGASFYKNKQKILYLEDMKIALKAR